jgi:hypothetical protein
MNHKGQEVSTKRKIPELQKLSDDNLYGKRKNNQAEFNRIATIDELISSKFKNFRRNFKEAEGWVNDYNIPEKEIQRMLEEGERAEMFEIQKWADRQMIFRHIMLAEVWDTFKTLFVAPIQSQDPGLVPPFCGVATVASKPPPIAESVKIEEFPFGEFEPELFENFEENPDFNW